MMGKRVSILVVAPATAVLLCCIISLKRQHDGLRKENKTLCVLGCADPSTDQSFVTVIGVREELVLKGQEIAADHVIERIISPLS